MRHPLPTLTLIGLLAVTACSSDGSDDGSDDSAETGTTTAAAPTVADTTPEATAPAETTPATDTPTTTEAPPEPIAVLAAGAEIDGALGMFFDPQNRLWVASVLGGIFVIDPDTGETLERYPGDVASADDLTIAPDGTVYFTDIINGQVGVIDPDGTLREERIAVGPGANSITLSDDGRLFVGADFLGDGLFEVDPTGATPPRVVTPDPGWLNGMDFGPDGFIYAPRWTEGTIVRADPETGELTTIADNSESVYTAVKFDADGVLHAVEGSPAHVLEVDIATGNQSILTTLDGLNDNLAFDSTGRLFVSNGQNGSIREILDDGSVRVVKEPGFTGTTGIVVEEVDGVEQVTVLTTGAVITLDGETGEELARNASVPSAGEAIEYPALGGALRLDDSGLLLLDWVPGGGVNSLDLAGDAVIADSPFDFGYDVVRFGGDLYASVGLSTNVVRLGDTGPEPVAQVNGPAGLAATAAELYVTSHTDGTVLQLAADGALLEAPVVVAEGLDQPEGLAVLPDGGLVVVETGSGNVTEIDLASGDTTVLAEGLSPAFTLNSFLPIFTLNSVAVAPSGNIYVTSPGDGDVWRILAD